MSPVVCLAAPYIIRLRDAEKSLSWETILGVETISRPLSWDLEPFGLALLQIELTFPVIVFVLIFFNVVIIDF